MISVRHTLNAPCSNWRNPQMKYFYFRFSIYSFGAYLLWSEKFITTFSQKCRRIFLEKPQLCKGCRFVGVAPRKRSVIWREYQIQRDPLMLSVHETRSTTESFFACDCFKPPKFKCWYRQSICRYVTDLVHLSKPPSLLKKITYPLK